MNKKRAPHKQKESGSVENADRAVAAVERLLNTAASLMKKTPVFDRQSLEYLRRLLVTVRFTRQKVSERTTSDHPSGTPHGWLERANKSESPIDFIRREYAPWLANNSISRADIRRLDKPLYAALHHWIAKNGKLPEDLSLPTLKEFNDKKLAEAGEIRSPRRFLSVEELSPEDRAQLRLYKLAQKRRRRN